MLSEYVVLGEDNLVAAPLRLDFAQASTLTCAGATAWFALAESAPTRPGDTVVIMGTGGVALDRKSTRLNSSHSQISYAVFCLKKKKKRPTHRERRTYTLS